MNKKELQKEISNLRIELTELRKEYSDLEVEKHMLLQKYKAAMAEQLSFSTTKKNLNDRVELKHLSIMRREVLADVDKRTIKDLSDQVTKQIRGIITRGRIRAMYDNTYAIVRDHVFANYKVDDELVVHICTNYKSVEFEDVLHIVEEIREEEFKASEVLEMQGLIAEKLIKTGNQVMPITASLDPKKDGERWTIRAEVEMKDSFALEKEKK